MLADDHEYGAVLHIWDRACARPAAVWSWLRFPRRSNRASESLRPSSHRQPAAPAVLVISHVDQSDCGGRADRGNISRAATRHRSGHRSSTCTAMVPVDLANSGWIFTRQSCHKWLAPLRWAFFTSVPSLIAIRAFVLSWGRTPGGVEGRWQPEFDLARTAQPGSYLASPAGSIFYERAGIDDSARARTALAGLRGRSVSRSRASPRWCLTAKLGTAPRMAE